jgi:hypothetical protein
MAAGQVDAGLRLATFHCLDKTSKVRLERIVAHVPGEKRSVKLALGKLVTRSRAWNPKVIRDPVVDIGYAGTIPACAVNEFADTFVLVCRGHGRLSLQAHS